MWSWNLSVRRAKAGARDPAGARETEVLVDDDDALIRPAELASFFGKCILPRSFAASPPKAADGAESIHAIALPPTPL
jgi:hypothetical protein